MERLSTGALTRVIVFIMIIGGASSAFALGAIEGASVTVNGQTVFFSHPPQTLQGTLLAPIQPIADLMGATTRWNAESRTIRVDYGNTTVYVAMDNNEMVVRTGTAGEPRSVLLPVSPRILNGVEYYPIEAIARELGATVTWHAATNTTEIIAPVIVQPPPQTTAQGSAAATAAPPQTTPATTSPPASRQVSAPPPTRNYRSEAARRNVISPSVFSIIGYDEEWWGGVIISIMTTKLAGTIQGGKFGLNMELFNMDYSPVPYLSLGLGAGAGVTFRDGVQANWLGVKPYVGFTVPIWAESDGNFRIHGDGFLEVGYSGWGSLLTGSNNPGFALNPGFELGLGFMFDKTGDFWMGLEGSYGITFYPDSRLKHNIGLALRFWPNWW